MICSVELPIWIYGRLDGKRVYDFVGRTFAKWRIESNRVFLGGHDCPVKAAEGLWKHLHKSIKAGETYQNLL